MPTAPAVTTARLSLRCFRLDDLDLFDRLQSDPRVTKYTGGPKTRAQSEEMLQTRVVGYYDQHPGLGIWATLERATGACVGLHLVNNIQGETLLQLGYLLFPEHWGKGYATEMSLGLVRYAFTTLGLPVLHAMTDMPNVASQQVLLKAGLHRKGERAFPHPAYVKAGPMAWFECDAQSWLAEHP